MGDRSKIEWTDASWNPIRARHRETGKVGWHCVHASPGCVNCYAEDLNHRLGTGLPYQLRSETQIELFLDEEALTQPLRWRRPRMIFPCSMTDLFAPFVTDEMIDATFGVMALTARHTYQVLTKRVDRMRAYLSDPLRHNAIELAAEKHWPERGHPAMRGKHMLPHLPLPNVWLGVSVEDQQRADERIPDLLATPAAMRFISAEPLLDSIDVSPHLVAYECHDCFAGKTRVTSHFFDEDCPACNGTGIEQPRLDLVIVGGESGPRARPFVLGWGKDLVRQCRGAGVSVFVKQVGAKPTNREGERCPNVHDRKGGNPAEWPEELRVRELPR